MASRFLKRSVPLIRSYENKTTAVAVCKPCYPVSFGRSFCVTGNEAGSKIKSENGEIDNGTSMVIEPVVSTGSLIKTLISSWFPKKKNLDKKPRFVMISPDEIQLKIPAGGLKTTDIKMHVDVHNRFTLVGQNYEGYWKQPIALPINANFEKAVFKAKVEDGFVHVTLTNFRREDVVLRFDSKK